MSLSESEKECPLCMEALDWDDLGFFPCSCGYQICRFCWHRLRTDENGLCPACRQAFPDIPVSFNPEISAEELKKQKKRNKERRSNKDQVFKPQDLATLRVVQKNLVFVIGLSSRLTQEDLKKEFAHFGKIIKFVHNKSTAYITYSKPEEAIRAIRTLNASAAQESVVQHLQFQSQLTNGTSVTVPTTNIVATPTTNSTVNSNLAGNLSNSNSIITAMSVPVPPNRLKASLGTTKYCNHFLRSQQCPKVGECMYLHEIAETEASFTKEQMQAGKHVEYEKKLMDSYLAKLECQADLSYVIPGNSGNNGYVAPNSAYSALSASLATIKNRPNTRSAVTLGAQLAEVHPQSSGLFQSTTSSYGSPLPSDSQHQQQAQQQQQQLAVQAQAQSQPTYLSVNHQDQSSSGFGQVQNQSSDNKTIVLAIPAKINFLTDERTSTTSKQQSQQIQPQQQVQHQQQLVLDTDSEDDGLDFDPISVSTSGLRDLLDQQVQQAKQQLQMQNYFQQQLNSEQSLANALFQQSDRLNHTAQTNGLIGELSFNGHPQTLTSLAGFNNSSNQQQQVTWQNLSAWTNFLQRSGYGFENGR